MNKISSATSDSYEISPKSFDKGNFSKDSELFSDADKQHDESYDHKLRCILYKFEKLLGFIRYFQPNDDSELAILIDFFNNIFSEFENFSRSVYLYFQKKYYLDKNFKKFERMFEHSKTMFERISKHRFDEFKENFKSKLFKVAEFKEKVKVDEQSEKAPEQSENLTIQTEYLTHNQIKYLKNMSNEIEKTIKNGGGNHSFTNHQTAQLGCFLSLAIPHVTDINGKIKNLEDFIDILYQTPCSRDCPQIRQMKFDLLFNQSLGCENILESLFSRNGFITEPECKLPQNIKDFITEYKIIGKKDYLRIEDNEKLRHDDNNGLTDNKLTDKQLDSLMTENLYFRDRLYMTSASLDARPTFFWYDENYNWYIPISKDNEKGEWYRYISVKDSEGNITKKGYTTDFDIYKYGPLQLIKPPKQSTTPTRTWFSRS